MQPTSRNLLDDTIMLLEQPQSISTRDALLLDRQPVVARASMPKGPSGSLEQQALRLAESKEGILIKGEPGSGKRYYAELIHSKSPQGYARGFVEVSSLMGEDELKAVLFNEDRKRCEGMLGRTVPALDSRSTLFIHHVQELSFLSQTRVARFLMQNASASPPQGPRVRVIVSSCSPTSSGKTLLVKSLHDQIREFRLLEIPPLRDRKEDIPVIAANLLKRIATERGGKRFALKPETLNQLMQHQWRDNVRELRAVLDDATRSSRNGSLTLPASFFDEVERVKDTIGILQMGKGIRVQDFLDTIEKTLVQRALIRWKFNLARTARVLGLSEPNLRYRIRKYKLHLPPVPKRK